MATSRQEKLTIEAFKKPDRKGEVKDSDRFVVMFNPITFDRKIEVEYRDNEEAGSGNRPPIFKKINPGTFDCEFTIDGTGVSAPKVSVTEQVEKFLRICGTMNGEIHRTNYLKISWGNFVFDCVFSNADISYTLFSNKDCVPLRAKITASFIYSTDLKVTLAEEDKKSPDLTHLKTVLEGDKINLMTNSIYGENKSLYIEVAKFNRLNNFRKLKSGVQLAFPPIDKKTQ